MIMETYGLLKIMEIFTHSSYHICSLREDKTTICCQQKH